MPLTPLDLARTLMLQRFGAYDPTATLSAGGEHFVKWFQGPAGPLRVSMQGAARAGELRIDVEGEGAEALVEAWRAHFPPDDGRDAFAPEHPLVRRLHREFPGLRFLRVPWLFDVACNSILQQRIAFRDAVSEFRRLVQTHGDETPWGRAFPTPKKLSRLPSWELERLGIDGKRARTLLLLAREEVMHPFLQLATSRETLRKRLSSIRGIGPWTTETILGFGAGDPDALPLGDLHLPHIVSWAFAREARGTDEAMVAHLAPFAGHRFRVTRLLYAGRIVPPRWLRRRRGRGNNMEAGRREGQN